jgi:DinB superfamily
MQIEFNITRFNRQVLARFFENHTLEQLNKIPDGFKNNLIWNIGHVVVSQQVLVYKGCGVTPLISEELVAKYMRGTKPEADVTQAEADEIKSLMFRLVDKTQEDYNNGVFTTYNARTSEMGFSLQTVEDAIAFNNHHEGIHLGIMLQLKKFI